MNSENHWIPNTVTSLNGIVHAYDHGVCSSRPYVVTVCGMDLYNWFEFVVPEFTTCKRCLLALAKGARQ